MTRARLTALLVVLGSLALGFALTAGGVATWDSLANFDRSRWLLHAYGLPSSRTANGLDETMKWYGPLWALFLGLMSEVELKFLHDPTWVQHAFNFALFPVGLYATERLLERAGVRRSTAILAAALLFGAIRLGGHALVNVNDFPMAMLSLLVMLYLWTKLREVDAGRARGRAVAAPDAGLAGDGGDCPVPDSAAGGAPAGHAGGVPGALRVDGAAGRALVAPRRAAGDSPRRRRRVHRRGLAGALGARAHRSLAKGADDLRPVRVERHHPLLRTVDDVERAAPLVSVHLAAGHAEPGDVPGVPLGTRARGAPPVACAPVVPAADEAAWNAGRYDRPSFDLSLRRWLAIHAALLWLGVIVLHPTIYDEERHLLFLYPPLLVLAALGLDDLGERLKYGLVVLVVANACSSYVHWGRYSYVYKSSLIGDRHAERFMGDYWAACVPLAIDALAGRVPAGAPVVVPGPLDPALIQYARRRAGPHALPGFGPYRIVREPVGWPAYVILNNRSGRHEPALRAVAEGRARELWRTTMPPGDPACLIIAYDGLGGRPPAR